MPATPHPSSAPTGTRTGRCGGCASARSIWPRSRKSPNRAVVSPAFLTPFRPAPGADRKHHSSAARPMRTISASVNWARLVITPPSQGRACRAAGGGRSWQAPELLSGPREAMRSDNGPHRVLPTESPVEPFAPVSPANPCQPFSCGGPVAAHHIPEVLSASFATSAAAHRPARGAIEVVRQSCPIASLHHPTSATRLRLSSRVPPARVPSGCHTT